MATPPSGGSNLGTSAVETTTKLCDEALAAAQKLEAKAGSLHTTDVERSLQIQAEAGLLKSAAAAQAATTLDKERAQVDALEQQAATLRDRLRTDSQRDDDDVGSVTSEATDIAHLHS